MVRPQERFVRFRAICVFRVRDRKDARWKGTFSTYFYFFVTERGKKFDYSCCAIKDFESFICILSRNGVIVKFILEDYFSRYYRDLLCDEHSLSLEYFALSKCVRRYVDASLASLKSSAATTLVQIHRVAITSRLRVPSFAEQL